MKCLFLISSLLLCSFLNAQNIKVTGFVKDSLGNPLEMANVIATNKIDGSMVNYAITNYEGKFSISIAENNLYVLTATYLGMEATSIEVDLINNSGISPIKIVLIEDKAQLDGVELVYEMPVTVRGDTIVYNTDSFTTGNERKLGDVLKKLPGIRVDDNGEIEVEGKKVSKVMIDGKDFFDGDSKLATQNIPADALSKVEVLKNYNEVDQMRGLGNDEDNVAINIKLKDGKKNFWFGEVEGGLGQGEKTRYLGNSKLFYYSPKTSFNFIGNSNNIGDVPFTFRDYFNFTGGFRNFNSGSGTSFNINDSGLGFLISQNDRANEIQSHFGAVNATHQFSEKLNLSAFAIYSDNQTYFDQQSIRNYIQSGATEFISSKNKQQNRLGLLKFSTVYKPNVLFQLDYDVFLKNINQSERGETLSTFFSEDNIVENPIEENKQNKPYSINQNLNAYYTLNASNIFAGYFQHLFQEEDPFYNAILGEQPFSLILPLNQDQDNFNINQNRRIKTNKLDTNIEYYYIINDLSNINLNVGNSYSHQEFDSSIFEIIENQSINYFEDENLQNNVDFQFNDIFFGAKYKVKQGIFTFTPGLNFHNFSLHLQDQIGVRQDNITIFLPNFNALAQFRQSESLRFNYNIIADFTDINNLAEGYIFSNYNRLFKGNREIENGIFHNFNLNYLNFSSFNFTSVQGTISYSKRLNAIRNSTFIENINQVNSVINSEFVDDNISLTGSFQKKFRKFNANLQSTISSSTLNIVVNGENSESQNFAQNYETSFDTNFKSFPNFEIGYNLIINNYNNGGAENTFLTHRPFTNVEYNFLNGFTFMADYNYFNYFEVNGSIENEYAFLNAKLFYQKPGSAYEFSLNATNLLNVESINRDNFTENFNFTSQFFVQPRIVMLSVKYNL